MKVKEVPSAWIYRENRCLDCGPFLSGALETRLRIEDLRAKKESLGSLTKDGKAGIVNPGRIKRLWVGDSRFGIPFLSSTDILQADLSNLRYISKKAALENPRLIITRGTTLITRAGTIGRMAFTRQDMHGLACTEDVLRVIPDPDRVRPGYLYAFLSGRFGVPLVTSGTYGSIIQHLEPHHIADLPVPRLGDEIEQRAHALVEEAASLLTSYQANIGEATTVFFRGVGLSDITSQGWHANDQDLAFETTFPCIDSFRALNFNPRYEHVCSRIRSGSWKPLGEICESGTLKRGGRFKRIDAEGRFAYQLIGQKALFRLKPKGRWIAKFTAGSDVLVDAGAILVAARGTLGESELYCRAEFIWGTTTARAYSEDILRIVADEEVMPRGALFAFMRSETAFRMLRSISVGTKLQDHHHVFREQLPIPYPSSAIREETHALVVAAYEARQKAVELEDQARALVEQAIEEAS